MTVEALPVDPFPHRKFMDQDEQERAIRLVSERGFETDGFETTGYFHAQLYLSRPESEAQAEIGWVE